MRIIEREAAEAAAARRPGVPSRRPDDHDAPDATRSNPFIVRRSSPRFATAPMVPRAESAGAAGDWAARRGRIRRAAPAVPTRAGRARRGLSIARVQPITGLATTTIMRILNKPPILERRGRGRRPTARTISRCRESRPTLLRPSWCPIRPCSPGYGGSGVPRVEAQW